MTEHQNSSAGSARAKNADRHLWPQVSEDAYAPRLFVTEGDGIGIDVGGHVIVKPLRDWHALAVQSRTADQAAAPSKPFHPSRDMPGCMMPDGGECCTSYAALCDDWHKQRRRLLEVERLEFSTAGVSHISQARAALMHGAAQPVAWTNAAQLGFLKDPEFASVPMAMWGKSTKFAETPLYASQPSPAATVERNGLVECPTCVRRFKPGEHCDLDTCSLKSCSAEIVTPQNEAELEAVLNSEDTRPCTVLPDGKVVYQDDTCECPKCGRMHRSLGFGKPPSHIRDVPQAALIQQIEAEARRYAGMYPQSSDGRNTFVIFADWVASQGGGK